ACDVAAAMIASLAGGEVLTGAVVGSEVTAQAVTVTITLERINGYLGTTLTEEIVSEIFEALGFTATVSEGTYSVTVPPRRWDIQIEADLIEEVARIYGYNNLPSTLPSGETIAGSLTKNQRMTRKIRSVLEGIGLSEAISYALTTEKKASEFLFTPSHPTRLDWPMTEERSVLRMNLISGLLDDVAYNVARKNQQLAFYEIGNVFHRASEVQNELPVEENHLALALSGEWVQKDWQGKAEKVNYFHLKGALDHLFESLSLVDYITYQASTDIKEMHPGRTATIYLGEQYIGFIGQVHPTTAKAYDIPETYVAEINVEAIIAYEKTFVYQPVSKFPSVSRDIALLVEETVTNQAIVQVIQAAAGKYLTDVTIFDVYQGENIEKGHKSLAYSLTFANPEATLTDEEINLAMEKVTKRLTDELSAVIR
ncbi:MAG: phenylalanine--tRNA ligase subunit beta, partial [Enterococcus aquimarinus]